jgi:tetratricopeptide (TPR) repeat protein
MSRVTSLTSMPEAQLNRWIKRIGLLLIIGIVAFVAFYAIDRFRAPATAMVDQKLSALEEAVRTDPSNTVARGQLADLYLAKRRFEDAIAQYTVLIDANKEVEPASLNRARAYEQIGKYDEAIVDFNRVVEIALTGEMANIDPTLEAAYFGLGTVALAKGIPAEAIGPLKKALAIQRTDADALNALAKAYLGTGQPALAIESLQLAVALVPAGWADPYTNLATAYSQTGDAERAEWAGAMAAFAGGDNATAEKRLLGLVGGKLDLEAKVGLGLVAEAKGDTAASADWFRKALVIDPENMSAKLGLARVSMPVASPTAAPTEGSN